MLWICACCDFKNEAFFKKCWNCQAPYGSQCPLIWECAPVEERPEGFTLGYESPVESESEEEGNGEGSESDKDEEMGDNREMEDEEMTDVGEVDSDYEPSDGEEVTQANLDSYADLYPPQSSALDSYHI